jgi:hypothetical protein
VVSRDGRLGSWSYRLNGVGRIDSSSDVEVGESRWNWLLVGTLVGLVGVLECEGESGVFGEVMFGTLAVEGSG